MPKASSRRHRRPRQHKSRQHLNHRQRGTQPSETLRNLLPSEGPPKTRRRPMSQSCRFIRHKPRQLGWLLPLPLPSSLLNTDQGRRDPATPSIQTDSLLDTFFNRFHNKPFHIFDESLIRKRIQLNQLPPFLFDAIGAVAARYVPPH